MSRPDIVTLTVNPALDVTAAAEKVVPTEKIRCQAERYDAGGGGLNVARFATALGAAVAAVYTAGGATGTRITEMLAAENVSGTAIPIKGPTRESFTVNELSTGRQYRFVLPGPTLTAGEQAQCLDALRRAAAEAQFVVASGSLPPGVPPDFYQLVAGLCADLGARLILDTSGGGLTHISSGVFLLKPSVRELRECVGHEVDTVEGQHAAARALIDRGVAETIVVSLGAGGALLVTSAVSKHFSAIPVTTVSGVGAGDAMVAGITLGLTRRWDLPHAVHYGIAAATAKLSTVGTSAFRRDEVDRLFGLPSAPCAN